MSQYVYKFEIRDNKAGQSVVCIHSEIFSSSASALETADNFKAYIQERDDQLLLEDLPMHFPEKGDLRQFLNHRYTIIVKRMTAKSKPERFF